MVLTKQFLLFGLSFSHSFLSLIVMWLWLDTLIYIGTCISQQSIALACKVSTVSVPQTQPWCTFISFLSLTVTWLWLDILIYIGKCILQHSTAHSMQTFDIFCLWGPSCPFLKIKKSTLILEKKGPDCIHT